jgi:HEAT repeat protein
MELDQITTQLDSADPQDRMRGLVHLRDLPTDIVVPLLKRRMNDREFMIRSFVAMGLGNHRSEEGFQALVQLIECDQDANVRAHAASALAKYGEQAMPHLLQLFRRDDHWLVRQSILASMEGFDRPDDLLQLCIWGIQGQDLQVQLDAIAYLVELRGKPQEQEALNLLLSLVTAEHAAVRSQVARCLWSFDQPQAQAAISTLRQDSDHRVVAATLEGLLASS